MKITLEQIDLLRKRTNASYKEAKEALEQADGDIVGALAYLDEQGKAKKEKFNRGGDGLLDKIKNIFKRGNEIKLVVSKDSKDYLRVSLNIVILLAMLFHFWVVPALLLILIITVLGYKVHFEDHAKTYGIEIIRPQQKAQSQSSQPVQETKEADYTEI